MDESHNRCNNQSRSPPSSSCCSSGPTWPPLASPLMNESPPSRYYEELFCSSQTSVPLTTALITSSSSSSSSSSSGPQSDVVKQGHLGKLERNHRRYFVLRAGSHTGPSRLEWYKNQDKFAAAEKSTGKAAMFGSNKQGVIYLRCCLGVSRTGSSRKGHTVALYAKDQTLVLVVEDQQEQDEWYVAIKRLMEEERKDDGFDEEDDDGYCTLPPAAFFKEVWPVSVKPRGLGRSRSLTGETRLCLTASSLILVRLGACSDLPSVTIPLLSVRRFGHLDGSFFVELGRSAPDGPGEIWMEGRDQGNSGIAQHIHEAVREALRTLRALPDFNRSPTSSHCQPQALMVLKRSRPKYRDKMATVRAFKNTDTQMSPTRCHTEPHKPDRIDRSPFRSTPACTPPTDSYMEMKVEMKVERWELGEEEERLGYVTMSPQGGHGLPQDDYMTMASPHKHQFSSSSSSSSLMLLTSFNSSSFDSYSPVQPSQESPWLLTSVQPPETQTDQSQTDDVRQEQKLRPLQLEDTSHSDLLPPFITNEADDRRPVQTGSRSATNQSGGKKHRLLSCLPSCLQAEETS